MGEAIDPGGRPDGRGARLTGLAGLCGLAVLVAACFGPALLGGRQFIFRDAGHYYYPLYWSVQQQWRAGVVPLWQPAEDGGRPLLGSPQAAVLYPGKLIYAAMPHAWAARAYVVAHVLLAFAAMRALLRSWRVGGAGATLGGFAYAFGAPVLFQYCNVIYLVGAAWMPLGFRAADRWLRLGRRWGLVELSAVLAMEALGGDLEAAYLTGLCAAGYAAGLAARRPSTLAWLAGIGLALVGWAVVVAGLGPRVALLRSGSARLALATAWGVALLVLLARGTRGRGRSPLGARLLGLAASGALALALGAAQLAPVAEVLAKGDRWGEAGAADVEDFSVEPYRAAEWAWPDAFGSMLEGDRFWLPGLPPFNGHRTWTCSLYFGALPLALAIAAAGFRGGPPWRAWLSAVAVLGLLVAAGKFLDPPTWFGFEPGGSPYRLLTVILPGFGGFRYPAKFLVPVGLAASGLAGLGWDRAVEGRAGRAKLVAWAVLASSLAGLAVVGLGRAPILGALARTSLGRSRSMFGRFDLDGLWAATLGNFAHGAIATASALAAIRLARTRPALAGSAAILILAVDLAVANARLVVTLPQADLDRPSEVARIIAEAEADRPSPGGTRVFRMPQWVPTPWYNRRSRTRGAEVALWDRDTLLSNYGMLEGVDSIITGSGTVESEEFATFFRTYVQQLAPKVAANIGARPGQDALCYPRSALDLWGARYFLLPVDPGDWNQGERALLTLLERTELVYPRPGPALGRRRLEDFQVRRNLDAFPRAWTVHDFAAIDPDSGAEAAELARMTARRLSRGPSAASAARGLALDPRVSALIETDSPRALDAYRAGGPPGPSERPTIVREGPGRVELAATLDRPGLVVLADRFDPGWRATVDGQPAAPLRANRLMRAVAVAAGPHRIVYEYDPPSFRLGLVVSLASLVPLAAGCRWARRQGAGPPGGD